jgi:hypothetical protein
MKYLLLISALLVVVIPTILFAASPADSLLMNWSRRTGADLGYSQPQASDIARDQAGNLYVTGALLRTFSGFDIVTLKFGPDSLLKWERFYDGTAHGTDNGIAVAVDDSGFIYVTGVSAGAGTGDDIVLLKYDESGNTLWSTRYPVPGKLDESPIALAVDHACNVIVLGVSYPTQYSLTQYLTIKWNSSGVKQWSATYLGSSGNGAAPAGIATDDSGNVVVTGSVAESDLDLSKWDYATIKYSASGSPAWTAVYTGDSSIVNLARAMTVDDSGNVYVTGQTFDSSSHSHIATISYSPGGVVNWTSFYQGPDSSYDTPVAIAIDRFHNVVITGTSEGSGTGPDIATVKYDHSGVEQWARRFNGTTHDDAASSVAVDDSGNVYTSGRTLIYGSWPVYTYAYVTLKYSPTGDEKFTSLWNSPSARSLFGVKICIDPSGAEYLVGNSDHIDLLRYNRAGTVEWASKYTGPGYSYDLGTAIAIDASGNRYCVGTSAHDRDGTLTDISLVKYSPAGEFLWRVIYDDSATGQDYPATVLLDQSGNPVVVGSCQSVSSGFDLTVLKYSSAGEKLWEYRYNGPANGDEFCAAAVIDTLDNVYATGSSIGNDAHSASDYITFKLNGDGVRQWLARYDGRGSGIDGAAAIALDDSVNVAVTGNSLDTNGMSVVTIRYNSSGEKIWEAAVGSQMQGVTQAHGICVDANRNIIVLAGIVDSTDMDYVIAKYSPSGSQLLRMSYNGTSGGDDTPIAMMVDDSSNIVVTGYSQGAGTGQDIATIKYGPGGNFLWAARFNGTGASNDIPAGMIHDGAGNIYITGSIYRVESGAHSTFLILKYSPNGLKTGSAQFNGDYGTNDVGSAIAIDRSGNISVLGSCTDEYNLNGMWDILSYTQILDGVVGAKPHIPEKTCLNGNYPNPFNPETIIRYQLATTNLVHCTVYNLLGQKVATLVDEVQSAGEKSVRWDGAGYSSGMYFCRLEAVPVNGSSKSYTGVVKMLLVR